MVNIGYNFLTVTHLVMQVRWVFGSIHLSNSVGSSNQVPWVWPAASWCWHISMGPDGLFHNGRTSLLKFSLFGLLFDLLYNINSFIIICYDIKGKCCRFYQQTYWILFFTNLRLNFAMLAMYHIPMKFIPFCHISMRYSSLYMELNLKVPNSVKLNLLWLVLFHNLSRLQII